MINNVIINADDLGMTPGTNRAIFLGYDDGVITHTSLMTNCDYFNEAVAGIKERDSLNVGIHLNLTYGQSLNPSPIYCDNYGIFNLGYIGILYKSLFDRKFLKEVRREFELQIEKAVNKGILITHLDSHRHIHLIPGLYTIVVKISKKYRIPRVRLINENIFESTKINKNVNFLFNGNLVKYLLLTFFTRVNIKRHNDTYKIKFFSILYTGSINNKAIQFYKRKVNGNVEITVHPSCINIDQDVTFYDEAEKKYRLSLDREIEFKNIKNIGR